MPGLLLTGVNSAICRELEGLILDDDYWRDRVQIRKLTRHECDLGDGSQIRDYEALFSSSDRIVLAHGAMGINAVESLKVNLLSCTEICEQALRTNANVRICVLGSESATKGSHDFGYWFSKNALHSYVRERRLEHPGQQLVCVAPSAIEGTRMTSCKSVDEIAAAKAASPKQRLATPAEVARLIHFLLFVDEGYITNTVVEINGGKFARRCS